MEKYIIIYILINFVLDMKILLCQFKILLLVIDKLVI